MIYNKYHHNPSKAIFVQRYMHLSAITLKAIAWHFAFTRPNFLYQNRIKKMSLNIERSQEPHAYQRERETLAPKVH